ncbi:MAG: alpha/beta hydrolase [Solirubrobacteraceae bacterium]|jgi:acetyl esterase/lipase
MPSTRLLLDFLTPGQSHRYADAHRCQRAELHLPPGSGPHPVVVTIHGGSWSAGVSKPVMRGLAASLVRQGYAAWNIEYRRLGRGQNGGWPTTFEDVAAAIDHLDQLAAPLDLDAVTIYGHSAGGHLALWAASRGRLPEDAPGARPRVAAVAAVSAAGVCDLAQTYRESPGGVVGLLMGGGPEEVPERYAVADPIALVPPPADILLVHGTDDVTVSVRRSRNYAAAARAVGADLELVEIAGEAGRHRSHILPASASWAAVTRWLQARADAATRGGRGPSAAHTAATATGPLTLS